MHIFFHTYKLKTIQPEDFYFNVPHYTIRILFKDGESKYTKTYPKKQHNTTAPFGKA